jgi:hypothetical protein
VNGRSSGVRSCSTRPRRTPCLRARFLLEALVEQSQSLLVIGLLPGRRFDRRSEDELDPLCVAHDCQR